jgi:hypothetical protein
MLAVCAGAGLLAAGRTAADTAVLADGTMLRGKVEVAPSSVSVTSKDGTLTVPRWQVVQVFLGVDLAPPKETAAAAPAASLAGRAPAAAAPGLADVRVSVDLDRVPLKQALEQAAQAAGARVTIAAGIRGTDAPVDLHVKDAPLRAALDRLLAPQGLAWAVTADGTISVAERQQGARAGGIGQKISVDFEGVSLYNALQYVCELTAMGSAVHADVRADVEPVDLRVRDLPARVVLDLMLRPGGYHWSVEADDVLYVGRTPLHGEYVVRVYSAADLLLSTEDLTAGTSAGGTSGTSGRSAGGSTATPQYAGSAGRATGQLNGGGGGAGTTGTQYEFSPITDRAANLILLMKQACGPDTWMSPASSGLIDVRNAGGGQRNY